MYNFFYNLIFKSKSNFKKIVKKQKVVITSINIANTVMVEKNNSEV